MITSELRTLRPLGLEGVGDEDDRGADVGAAAGAGALVGVVFWAEPADGAAVSGFCPITF